MSDSRAFPTPPLSTRVVREVCRRGGTGCALAGALVGAAGAAEPVLELSNLDGSDGVALRGVALNDEAGTAVAGIGDVNGDGVDDILIGAPGVTTNGTDAGAAYVVFGDPGHGDAGPALDLNTLDGSNGFTILGATATDRAGTAVAGAGDVNGDGVDDMLIGAPAHAADGDKYSGAAYVVFGNDTPGAFGATLDLKDLDGGNGFKIRGASESDFAGTAVAGAGDMNGDGLDDILIGAPGVSTVNPGAGAAYVVFGDDTPGAFGATLDLNTLDGNNGVTLLGKAVQGRAGAAVSGAGDVNDDGLADALVGAPNVDGGSSYEVDEGVAYLVLGDDAPGAFGATLDLGGLSGNAGFSFSGVTGGDLRGTAVSGAGDINGDGVDDLLLGSPGARLGFGYTGAAMVILGGDIPDLSIAMALCI